MKKQQIQNLFNQRYNQAKWKQFLGQTFANVQLLSTPENLTGIDDHVATNAQKLGYILLDENGIDRQIAVYEVTLANGIVLERNRVGLRNLLRKYWQNIDAAFIVYHHPENTNWRFTYVSDYGTKLKEFIYQNTLLEKFIDLTDVEVFDSVITYTGIFLLSKNKKSFFKYVKLESNQTSYLKNLSKIEFDNISYDKIQEKTWLLSSQNLQIIFDKINSLTLLSELSDKIFQGLVTS
ncbi:hypothetical protein [Dolichospermum circinale]|uniref:hypothetical protein n=1 Tax=Dolichospermum circinale TaxID=109265 RepID=UPI00232F6847|nr:hypothetical protein [Dolichospermum circinale]MDB9467217.1 hypothetical protein [Dolichospermum circinale CS-539/09]MDB9470352.1 hypothetical protein [Dolichospermum circinale CS-539]